MHQNHQNWSLPNGSKIYFFIANHLPFEIIEIIKFYWNHLKQQSHLFIIALAIFVTLNSSVENQLNITYSKQKMIQKLIPSYNIFIITPILSLIYSNEQDNHQYPSSFL
jgi:hypothetical protein